MNPEMPRESLADQPWFVDFLAANGFAKSSPTTFIREQASLEVEGTELHADPGNGEKGWSTDFGDANPASVKAVLEQILKMRPFLSSVDLAQERIEKQSLERALAGIAATIKDGPDTGSGVQLRRFLWSLYNGHHLINLWKMTCVLDGTRGGWVSEVCAGAFVGALKEDDIKRALLVAGEMQRWDDVEPSDDHKRQIQEAIEKVEDVLKTLPPSRSHTELDAVRKSLWEAKDALRKAKENGNSERHESKKEER